MPDVAASDFILGTQYFRPPFPKSRYWADDLKAMRDAGLNAVQLWMVWGWIEPEPGTFVFDDYERLADLAAKNGLGIVLSTLPEINPFWVPRLHPEGMMVDIEGNVVRNCNRWECISGLVPGACSDNPDIRKRMIDFLTACAERFAPRENLLAWDVWNENRWRNMAPDVVCFCDHSLASLREFLKAKHGDLAGLSEAWGRRVTDWADVRIGRLYGYSYPEWKAFTDWMAARAREMAAWRIDSVRAVDTTHPVSTHTGNPTVFGGVNLNENLFSRGIDWDVALGDTYGYSSFPHSTRMGSMPPEVIAVRTSSMSGVGDGKMPIWMSELQGGPSAGARTFSPPLPGDEQQGWIWQGISRGVKAMVFWCWREEVFGCESGGFGFTARDGMAESRKQAMRRTSEVIEAHADAVRSYRPDAPEVGVLFQRDSVLYGWIAQQFHGAATNTPVEAAVAWYRALERQRVPYTIYDDRHLPADPKPGKGPGALKLMIVPDAEALDDDAAEWLATFVENGGTVFVEGAAGLRGADSFFRYPGDRPLYRLMGVKEDLFRAATRRVRVIPAGTLANDAAISVQLDTFELTFAPDQPGVAPLDPDGLPMLINKPVGRGRFIALGSVVAARLQDDSPAAMNALVKALVRLADAEPAVCLRTDRKGFVTWRLGRAGHARLLFVQNFGRAQRVTVRLAEGVLPEGAAPSDWFGREVTISRDGDTTVMALDMAAHATAVLEWEGTDAAN